jgi:hypothetical protein
MQYTSHDTCAGERVGCDAFVHPHGRRDYFQWGADTDGGIEHGPHVEYLQQ